MRAERQQPDELRRCRVCGGDPQPRSAFPKEGGRVCRRCKRRQNKAWYLAHKDRWRIYSRRLREKRKDDPEWREDRILSVRLWYHKHREEELVKRRAAYWADRPDRIVQERAAYRKHRDRILLHRREFYRANRERLLAAKREAYARKRGRVTSHKAHGRMAS